MRGIERKWTPEELDCLRRQVAEDVSRKAIARELNRSMSSIYNQIHELGIAIHRRVKS
jgi:hypothetical protein